MDITITKADALPVLNRLISWQVRARAAYSKALSKPKRTEDIVDITVAKNDLLQAAKQAAPIAPNKSPLHMLQNILLTAVAGKLHLSVTDLELSLTCEIAAEVRHFGTVAVHAKDLVERLSTMPAGPVHLSHAENRLAMRTTGARRYAMPALPGEDFPTLASVPDGAVVSVDSALLGSMIGRVQTNISDDTTRPTNAALFEWDGDTVRMVATDGHRLAKIEHTVPGLAHFSMLLPQRTWLELRRFAATAGKELRILIAGNEVYFSGDSATLATKQSTTQFPPYLKVIPKGFTCSAVVSRTGLADAVKAVALSSLKNKYGVTLCLQDRLSVSAVNPESGDAYDELSADYHGAEPLTIAVNADYMADALSALASDTVWIEASDTLAPIVVRPCADSPDIFLIMPMRV